LSNSDHALVRGQDAGKREEVGDCITHINQYITLRIKKRLHTCTHTYIYIYTYSNERSNNRHYYANTTCLDALYVLICGSSWFFWRDLTALIFFFFFLFLDMHLMLTKYWATWPLWLWHNDGHSENLHFCILMTTFSKRH